MKLEEKKGAWPVYEKKNGKMLLKNNKYVLEKMEKKKCERSLLIIAVFDMKTGYCSLARITVAVGYCRKNWGGIRVEGTV